MSEFPKMLFKAGGAFEWQGMKLDSKVVANADEQAAAFADGWLTSEMLVDGGDDVAPEPVEPAAAPRRGRPRKVA